MSVQTMDDINPTTENETPQEPAQVEQQPLQQHEPEQQDHPEGQQPDGDQQESEASKASQKRGGLQTRIDELTRARHDAQREAQYWREQAEKQQGILHNTEKPTRADFDNEDDYFEALADYKAEQKLSAFREQSQEERVQQAEARQSATRFELFQERIAQSAEALPDYEDVVGGSDVPTAGHVLDSIVESDMGPQIAYHLAKHPEAVQRMNEMTPLQVAREIGRLEAQLSQAKGASPQPTPKRTTNAPAPITPVRGNNGQFTKAPDAMTDAEWYAANRK